MALIAIVAIAVVGAIVVYSLLDDGKESDGKDIELEVGGYFIMRDTTIDAEGTHISDSKFTILSMDGSGNLEVEKVEEDNTVTVTMSEEDFLRVFTRPLSTYGDATYLRTETIATSFGDKTCKVYSAMVHDTLKISIYVGEDGITYRDSISIFGYPTTSDLYDTNILDLKSEPTEEGNVDGGYVIGIIENLWHGDYYELHEYHCWDDNGKLRRDHKNVTHHSVYTHDTNNSELYTIIHYSWKSEKYTEHLTRDEYLSPILFDHRQGYEQYKLVKEGGYNTAFNVRWCQIYVSETQVTEFNHIESKLTVCNNIIVREEIITYLNDTVVSHLMFDLTGNIFTT